MKAYDITITDLDRAILARVGEFHEDGGRLRLSDDAAAEMECVAGHGCACGCPGAFIYYTDTFDFFKENRAALKAQLAEQVREGFFGEGVNTVVGAVCAFRCLADEDRGQAEETAARLFYGDPDEAADECDLALNVANAIVWGAVEDLASRLDGCEVEEVDPVEEAEG